MAFLICIRKPRFLSQFPDQKAGKCLARKIPERRFSYSGVLTFLQSTAFRRLREIPQTLTHQLLQFGEVLDGADHLAGVAVLVVVPGHDLHLIGVQAAKRLAIRFFGLFKEC